MSSCCSPVSWFQNFFTLVALRSALSGSGHSPRAGMSSSRGMSAQSAELVSRETGRHSAHSSSVACVSPVGHESAPNPGTFPVSLLRKYIPVKIAAVAALPTPNARIVFFVISSTLVSASETGDPAETRSEAGQRADGASDLRGNRRRHARESSLRCDRHARHRSRQRHGDARRCRSSRRSAGRSRRDSVCTCGRVCSGSRRGSRSSGRRGRLRRDRRRIGRSAGRRRLSVVLLRPCGRVDADSECGNTDRAESDLDAEAAGRRGCFRVVFAADEFDVHDVFPFQSVSRCSRERRRRSRL